MKSLSVTEIVLDDGYAVKLASLSLTPNAMVKNAAVVEAIQTREAAFRGDIYVHMSDGKPDGVTIIQVGVKPPREWWRSDADYHITPGK